MAMSYGHTKKNHRHSTDMLHLTTFGLYNTKAYEVKLKIIQTFWCKTGNTTEIPIG